MYVSTAAEFVILLDSFGTQFDCHVCQALLLTFNIDVKHGKY